MRVRRLAADDFLAAAQHGVHRQRFFRADGIEIAERARFGQPDHPFAQIAAVDDLHRVGAVAGHQHFAALRDAMRPVGEAIGLVARADDVAGAHDGHALAELFARFGFAERLERAVQILDVGAQRFLRFGHRVLAFVRRSASFSEMPGLLPSA